MAGLKQWTAKETSENFGGGKRTLTVEGQVETSNSNQTPSLKEASPQGVSPKILVLDVAIETSGVGADVMGVRDLMFKKTVSDAQYDQVTIRQQGKPDITVDVEQILS